MYGITTNYASTAALRNLQSINKSLETTQGRIASGLKVASAKDGAAAWSAATAIRSEISTYGTLIDDLDYYSAAADTAATAAESIVDALNDIKTALTNYQNTSDTDEQDAYVDEIEAAQDTIIAALAASTTDSVDWLSNTTAISFNTGVDSSGGLLTDGYTPGVDLDDVLTNTAIGGTNSLTTFITTFTSSDMSSSSKIDDIEDAIDTAITNATSIATGLGAMADRIDSHETFLQAIYDIKESALSTLVDADMEEESAKLSALEVQQQLAITALQISNSSSQNILALFQ
ncbi:flagellin [Consotaella aegiceratis]|uniref:flagellin n=1 Tax=Consotaella aegiceratis TaxID=3097961 RepID=UPI002F3E6FDB